jgi:putative peptidoglycan lipid II flippase
VRIRSSPSATPATLENTTALTAPARLRPGTNSIKVNAASPTTNLLVDLHIGNTNGKSQAEVYEITVQTDS